MRNTWPVKLRELKMFAIAIAVSMGVWTLIGLFITNVWEGTWFHEQETRVDTWFEDQRTADRTEVSEWATSLANTETAMLLVLFFAVFAVWRWRRWTEAVFVMSAALTELSVFLVVTKAVDRMRPPVVQLDGSLPTASFPSGHSGAATVVYGSLLVIALWHLRRRPFRWPVAALLAVAPFLVITSRLYRGMHYPTDVTAGFLNGVVSIAVAYFILRPAIDAAGLNLRGQPTDGGSIDLGPGGEVERASESVDPETTG